MRVGKAERKITFPIDVWGGGEGSVPIVTAGAESDLQEDYSSPDHTYSANSKTESHEVQAIHSHSS